MMNLKPVSLSYERYKDIGLLILRLGIGLTMMILHGYGKLTRGPEGWERMGGQMQNLGINFLPMFWGFMAAFSEFFCSILLILGAWFRPAAALLVATMFVAAMRHLSLPAESDGAGFRGALPCPGVADCLPGPLLHRTGKVQRCRSVGKEILNNDRVTSQFRLAQSLTPQTVAFIVGYGRTILSYNERFLL